MSVERFLQRAHVAREVQVAVPQISGELLTPIWIVTTMDHAFVRSYRADKGHWFQYVIGAESFHLTLEGEVVSVRSSIVTDPEMLIAVDAAYRDKYPEDAELADMLTPAVVATTLLLTMCEAASEDNGIPVR